MVLFGYTSRNDAGEVAVFFQDEDFYYLTGYSEPDAALVLIPDSANAKPLERQRKFCICRRAIRAKQFGAGRIWDPMIRTLRRRLAFKR